MTLEQLLNKLIELGRKPRGRCVINIDFDIEENLVDIYYSLDEQDVIGKKVETFSINDLCSLDSGLWQFVVESALLDCNYVQKEREKTYTTCNYSVPEWLVMLSSIQENRAQFLLDNIKVEGQQRK